jgi:hypothetical protein
MGGVFRSRVRLDAPIPMKHGKTMWELFTCMNEFQPMPIRTFNAGPCVNWACFDGLHCAPLVRLFKARNELVYDAPEIYGSNAGQSELEKLTDFTLGMRCMIHFFNLATRWGLAPWCSADILDSLHIGIKSLSNCGQDLVDQIDVFVHTRLGFRPRPSSFHEVEAQRQTWILLVHDAALASLFVEYGFWFDSATEMIFIYDDFRTVLGVHANVVTLITGAFHWYNFSDTRWLGSNKSCRMCFFSLFSGLEYCFKLCRDDCNVNMRLLNGHSKATAADVRYYGALTCFSALVAESAAAILLEDDRFLLNNVEVKEAMQTEIAHIQQVDARVFE